MKFKVSGLRNLCRVMLGLASVVWFSTAQAQPGPFDSGWTLQPEGSSLAFQSIKGGTKVEASSFASLEGQIDEDGTANVVVFLESVDTKIDLRNVRMRFLFFETFQFPEARISAQIDLATLTDLPQVRRKTVSLPYTLDLHGVTKSFEADVTLTLLSDNQVIVSTAAPISVSVEDFGLSAGLEKLEEAAGLPIVPSATVTFDFMFNRNDGAMGTQVAAVAPAVQEQSRALETSGDFGLEECNNRFETLSNSGGIFFRSGSARLDSKSAPLLDSLAEIVDRCPGLVIEVAGHTDSVGGEAANQQLSEKRASSVAAYLFDKGIDNTRIVPNGYGESQPVATNDTSDGRRRNRRIEFLIVGG